MSNAGWHYPREVTHRKPAGTGVFLRQAATQRKRSAAPGRVMPEYKFYQLGDDNRAVPYLV